MMKLQFLGANRQVTGSRYLLDVGGLRLMIDCGLFQERPFLSRNWDPSPVDPSTIDALLLTHAHLDHCGLIPKLVREGFSNPILCTGASIDLARLVLVDSAKIQEEDAAYKKRRHERERRTGPYLPVPLYTADDAQAAFKLFKAIEYNKPLALNDRVTVEYLEAGHILGSAMIRITVREGGQNRTILFSGDIGLWHKPLIRDPAIVTNADVVIMESTYGNREHDVPERIDDQLARIVTSTAKRGGNVVIPTFAIDRAQEMIYHFSKLVRENRMPQLAIYLDSPMAVDATRIFQRYDSLLDADTAAMLHAGHNPFRFPGLKLVQTVEESRAINTANMPRIIMAGAGMCTGGRIKHHLSQNISRSECTILFVGYQAQGTLGREILDGQPQVRIHGRFHQVKAKIERLDGISAHADRKTLLFWLGKFQSPPTRLFLTHGEESAALALQSAITQQPGWNVDVPEYQQSVDLLAIQRSAAT